jgi:hypothetical protein
MNDTNDINEPEKTELNQSRTDRYLLNNETFERLKIAQERIREQTELVPKMRKIINDILNEENLELYIEQFIAKHRD